MGNVCRCPQGYVGPACASRKSKHEHLVASTCLLLRQGLVVYVKAGMSDEELTIIDFYVTVILKLKCMQYPAILTNYIISHCTTLQYNHNI